MTTGALVLLAALPIGWSTILFWLTLPMPMAVGLVR